MISICLHFFLWLQRENSEAELIRFAAASQAAAKGNGQRAEGKGQSKLKVERNLCHVFSI